jgi:hypothetical protein
VHNRVRQEPYQRLKKQVTSDLRLLEESPMSRTGLRLALVPNTLVQEAGREVQVKDSDIQAGQMSLSNWQPDIVGISFCPEVTIPSDSRPQALTEAFDRKIKCYWPLTRICRLRMGCMCSPLGGWSARNGPTRPTNTGAGVPQNLQTEMDIHNRVYCQRVCGRTRIYGSLHRLNTAASILTTRWHPLPGKKET